MKNAEKFFGICSDKNRVPAIMSSDNMMDAKMVF